MNNQIIIRPETANDHQAVFNLITAAFEKMEFTDHREQYLVERLRRSSAFIPELSLVAVLDGRIAGYVLLTRISIVSNERRAESLALAPVAVLPECQQMGIGGKLITRAHEIAAGLGYTSVVLLGHADYYPRFGYLPAHHFGIALPFDVPAENCMVCELTTVGLQGVQGMVEYPEEFFQ